MLWLSHAFEREIVASSLPALRAVLSFAQDDFTLLRLDIAQEGPNQTLRLRADYAHPIYVGGQFVYPINPANRIVGWLQVNLTLGGLLQYGLLMSIAVLAWPASSIKEFMLRIALSTPALVSLFFVNTVSTLLAELWMGLHQDYAPQETWPLLAWSKFLMGGGGAMLALVAAAGVIVAGSRPNAHRKHLHADIAESHSFDKVT